MNVVVDTSVWSLALRRNTPNDVLSIVNILRDLIADGRVSRSSSRGDFLLVQQVVE